MAEGAEQIFICDPEGRFWEVDYFRLIKHDPLKAKSE
jgi:hypothetical protein